MKKFLFSMMLLFAFFLSGCNLLIGNQKLSLPNEGIWYCEELELEIDLSNESYSYITIDGKTVPCKIDGDYGCDWFAVGGEKGTNIGKVFFRGECDYWDKDKMLVTELLDREGTTKGKQYTFLRVE